MLRIGTLGTARITPPALLKPARKTAGVTVVAVGSRNARRADAWARKHGIPKAYGSYEQLIADPEVDAIYNPLPNSMHADWTVRAMEAGKHVLCEKPLAHTEAETKRMADAARSTGLIGMEAFHYRYHPLMARVGEIVRSGELGDLRRIDVRMSVPILLPRDIRWDPALAGGASMDLGCYAVNLARFVAGADPEVRTASGALTRRGVDRSFVATLAFPGGLEATLRCSLLGFPMARLDVRGTKGELQVLNPFLPQLLYRLKVVSGGAGRSERVADGTTYGHQLDAFVEAVVSGTQPPTDFEDAVANARVLDTIRTILGVRSA